MLQIGVTVLATGILIFFATRSPDGGLAGILLSGLVSWIGFAIVFAVAGGIWRESQRIEVRHAVLGGCLVALCICCTGGFLMIFGGQLLLGVVAGGLAAFLNSRSGSISWGQLKGLGASPASGTPGGAPLALPLMSPLGSPVGLAAAALMALVCVVIGVSFAGLGTIRALEGVSNITDFECSPPCAMVHGLWVQVIPDSHGQVLAVPDPATIELRVSFRDDAPGERVATAGEFTLTGSGLTYQQSLGRPECNLWDLHLHIDDRTSAHVLCFTIPSGGSVDPDQLTLDWALLGETAEIPLGRQQMSGGLRVGTENSSPS